MKRRLNTSFILIGLTLLALSLSFLSDRNFYFYPPEWAPTFNDLRIDIIALITGILLMICGFFNIKNDFFVGLLLAVAAAFVSFMLAIELIHIYFVGYFRLKPSIILDMYFLADIMLTAYYRRSTRTRKR
ncbi:hypothetical protein [Lactobacillus gigeriorum]|uniref:hypothetical protein n=1 Tax=Lactobacillus gigeriorum TaxID=1203069 RepID=UPI00058C0F89|nr:hypothetical protein [Lactobacillus gigeriorum]